ncbi:DNA translocase FtsK [Kaistia geumhonensis]|uniref:S-DNA-T family DNA segregation ATPase FtsK/SpoIIIE n=1 Tax=Kaistia geumhonensis TaxID=410839 RepID=A0ABU0M5P5_9HYPH|nr:DNA translocase FtsK [Kaistia geumhonensis]MCX5478507.1 DNA translocase FtsK [Kaistia geumhonensis]MDQ0516275.1 S-DNA-T family DNA segregation ATPase FtsK/SpoIIIE [Kaistia geumhonensis]
MRVPPHTPDGHSSEQARTAESATKPERGTLHLRRPIDARPDAGRPNAGKPDPFELRAADLASLDTVPSWLRPFTTTPTTRFTRTPDYLMRPRETPPPPPVKAPFQPATRLHGPARGPAAPQRPLARPQAPQAERPAKDIARDIGEEIAAKGATAAPMTPPPADPTPPAVIENPALPPVAAEPPAASLDEILQTMAEENGPAAEPLPTLSHVARMIRVDVVAPPERATEQDDIPGAPLPGQMASMPLVPEVVAPSVLPIEAPLRATVRVTFVWPVDDARHEDDGADGAVATAEAGPIDLPPLPAPAVVAPAPVVQPAPQPVAVAPAPTPAPVVVPAPAAEMPKAVPAPAPAVAPAAAAPAPAPVVAPAPSPVARPAAAALAPNVDSDDYEFPSLTLLAEPPSTEPDSELSAESLDRNSAKLQQTLRDFGVRGEIIDANPGPVVTLYELEPAPGTKSSRVIALSADIARSMSAVSARVAVVEGRNVIGIELPNQRRETVWLRELLSSQEFAEDKAKLGLCLGKTIGGEPVIADLARMPHLLVAGTTGSGKSVAINTMILSLLYQYKPEDCRLIMVDPKMLELSVYDGIPHLLTPVVTDPKKAVVALRWTVREMEERYRKMSRLGVRNIDGFNARVAEARAKGEVITRQIQTGFDKETGDIVHEEEVMDLTPLPYIVVIVDEMADLMMVAGKDIEGAIQRLAQMARAAGIHLIMATQRPSVDVITGTIKANFPTRISFQVTSKIDSRTILGEMGAETLLGQGDMLYMAGGGRIQRVHGPFVSDHEVEKVVRHLKTQGHPEYLDAVTSDEDEEAEAAPAAAGEDGAVFDKGEFGDEGADVYDQAVAIVLRDKKASTSYIQRRLQIGYNRAASIMERMEKEGIVGPANHAGKREILRER